MTTPEAKAAIAKLQEQERSPRGELSAPASVEVNPDKTVAIVSRSA